MRCALFVAVALGAAGCQSARVVSRTADDGVVAIPANTNDWPTHYQDAGKKIIQAHVGANYEVVEESEVTTGFATTNVQDRQFEPTMNTSNPFLPATRETTTTRTVETPQKEWRIHYRRALPRPATALTAAPATTVVNTAYVSGSPPAPPSAAAGP